jgi:hypothetical protein
MYSNLGTTGIAGTTDSTGTTGTTGTTTTSNSSHNQITTNSPIQVATTGLTDSHSSNSSVGGIVGGILAAIFVIIVVLVILFLRRRKNNNDKPSESASPKSTRSSNILALESLKSAQAVVKDIVVQNKLGGGHFSVVYKALWQGSTSVALKKLKSESQMEEFMSEAALLQ